MQVGTLHRAVLADIGTDDGLDAEVLHLLKKLVGGHRAALQPAFDRDEAVFDIRAYSDFVAVFFDSLFQKSLVLDCRRA